MSEILFSIVVPTYNRAHLITSTIESLTKQDYTNFEIIIVDDGIRPAALEAARGASPGSMPSTG